MTLKRFGLLAIGALSLLFCEPAYAQSVDSSLFAPTYLGTASTRKEAIGTFCIDPATGLVCSGGGGGGGGGDASASNQATQITAANLTNTRLGDITTPAAGTVNDRLGDILTALGSPFQAGEVIGNTAFGISGSLPTGSNTIGSIANTSFGISGTLPSFGSTQTFNLGTLNGAATAALQTSGNADLATLAGTVSAGNVNIVCTSGCSGGGGSGYSVLNASTYANNSTYSNVPSGGLVTTAAPTYTTGQASPLSLDTSGGLRVSTGTVPVTGTFWQATQPVSGTFWQATQPVSAASLPLPTGAATSANQTTEIAVLGAAADAAATQGSTGSISAKLRTVTSQLNTIATSVAAATPAGTNVIGTVTTQGRDAANTATIIRTDTNGGVAAAGATPSSTRSASLTTSTSTALGGGGSTTRPSFFKIQIEGALTANLFLCLNNQTCSPTVYDEMIPSGATAGTRLFVEIPFSAAVNYYTTATAIVNVTRWSN